jgi:tight adherence protein C
MLQTPLNPRGRPGNQTPFERVLSQSKAGQQDQPPVRRALGPLLDRLTDQSSFLTKNMNVEDLRYRLLRAGFPYGIRAREFLTIKILSTILVAILFSFILPKLGAIIGFNAAMLPLPARLLSVILVPLIGALYGWKIPDTWLSIVIKKRQFLVQMALPDMIDLISISVEAGLGLYAAMQRVSTRFKNPLSEELLRALQEVRLGRSHPEALRDMAKRVDVADLSMLVTALVQAEVLGIAISNVLTVQAERLREKRSQRAREQAQKAPIKMLFPLVLFIFPALFVVILGPAMIKIMFSGAI